MCEAPHPTGAGPPDPSESLAGLGESGEKINSWPWGFLQDAGAFAPALAADRGRCSPRGLRSPMLPSHSCGDRGLGTAEPGRGGREGTRLSRKEPEQKLRPRGRSDHSSSSCSDFLFQHRSVSLRTPQLTGGNPSALPAADATADSAHWGGEGLAGAPSLGPSFGERVSFTPRGFGSVSPRTRSGCNRGPSGLVPVKK